MKERSFILSAADAHHRDAFNLEHGTSAAFFQGVDPWLRATRRH
jgi:hypothetical protein